MASEKDIQILQKLKAYFEAAVNAPAYQAWRKESREAWNFYDGDQWTREEIGALAEHGQPAIVINKIASKVDNLAGTEIAGRTRVIYRSRSGITEEEITARALSDLALYVAERGGQSAEISAVFRCGLVCGIGWLDVGVDERLGGPDIFARAEDEMAVVWDPMSRRLDFGDARYICRERWMSEEDLERFFPDQAGKVREVVKGETTGVKAFAARYGSALLGRGNEEIGYVDEARDMYRVVEVQHYQNLKQYRVRMPDGTVTMSFDKAAVKAMEASGGEVEAVAEEPRVHVGYFVGDVLLEHLPLAYPHNRFTLVPYVYKRNREDGRPYGMVRAALDPQRELNKRRSKAMHLLNTAQVIADIDAVEDPNILAREAARPDGIILKRAGKDLRIIRNTDLAVSQVNVMEQAARDIQDVIGVFDENIGKQSNAVSGTAIQNRQMAGSMNQMFAFDALRATKKRMGEQILALIREYFTHEMVIKINDRLGDGRVVKLNIPLLGDDGQPVLDADGNPLKVNDVTLGDYDVAVEEVRDVIGGREYEAQQLEMLVRAGVPIPPQVLVEASGVSQKEVILAGLGAQTAK